MGIAPQTAHRIIRGKRWSDNQTSFEHTKFVRKVPPETHDEIRSLYASGGYTQRQLGEMFRCSASYVSRIINVPVNRAERVQAGRAARLTAHDVREIRRLNAEDGLAQYALARMFGVAPSTVHAIIRRRTWKNV